MEYKHLTAAQRGAIKGLLYENNCTLKNIAGILGVSLATVSRKSKREELLKDILLRSLNWIMSVTKEGADLKERCVFPKDKNMFVKNFNWAGHRNRFQAG